VHRVSNFSTSLPLLNTIFHVVEKKWELGEECVCLVARVASVEDLAGCAVFVCVVGCASVRGIVRKQYQIAFRFDSIDFVASIVLFSRIFCQTLLVEVAAACVSFADVPPKQNCLSKPRGLRAARKLRVKRRTQRWCEATAILCDDPREITVRCVYRNDKNYNHAHCGGWEKANPFQGASHAKGIVVERV
jgi:hypothetical protein